MTPSRDLEGRRAYGRTVESFGPVAWRVPTAARFEDHVANDAPFPQPTINEVVGDLPAWLHIVGGGVIAAMLGALLGGALHI